MGYFCEFHSGLYHVSRAEGIRCFDMLLARMASTSRLFLHFGGRYWESLVVVRAGGDERGARIGHSW